eukprot:Gregarina_sp_Poly_1__1329@NODE_132_length_13232_cov_209_776377_g118_i0_p3_GENE_NODE_132_length_13232_cov_209_776377_g118_i0NODE_132_length_13232_cov_209_776377_g118_i0_p3_ORF_typecomplete_len594_score75_86Hat1_N/PF10394_9/6_2e09Acetyltransf_10/PF13673_7/1_2e04Acetyltransf_10/PF13673_7/0_00036Acetyltransf_1/PF00583_25/1_2e03Acetyltransf_1/PF00583_25/0_002Acetyltransf_7/PF13508_7/0_023DUF2380/PF09533_10/0_049DUF2380/PF09533_10/6_6e03FR47/PF08445_10/4_2e02FR47/PF08445_10/2_3_NODE_132_length_13232_c
MPAAALTVDLFRLHACLSESDFDVAGPSRPASYIHHFFPEAQKWLCHPSLQIHVFYIPITFDTHVVIVGKAFYTAEEDESVEAANLHEEAELEARQRLCVTLEKSQSFPGGFIKSEEEFRARLRSITGESTPASPETLEPAAKKLKKDFSTKDRSSQQFPTRTRIPGRVIARISHPLPDSAGADNRYWLVEANLPPKSDDSEGPEENSFAFVHRRIEWFMHFYIDAMSSIHVDPRWRVFVALRYLSPFERLEQVRLEADQARIKQRSEQTGPGTSLMQLAESILTQWPTVDPHVKGEFMSVLDSYEPKILSAAGAMDDILAHHAEPAEVLALVTVYQFFALPRDRARISQFFVLPHRQRLGLGRQLLCTLHELLCADPQIRQVTVEDPAPAFQRLRDVCSVSLAVSMGVLRRECLYPTAEIEEASRMDPSKHLQAVPWAQHPAHPQRWPEYSAAFRYIFKETPTQRRRIKLLLKFGRLIPTPLLRPAQTRLTSVPVAKKKQTEETLGTPSRMGRRKLTPGSEETNELIEWQHGDPIISEIRVAEKQRFRLESIEWYSQKRTLGDVQNELETEWRSLFKSLCASLGQLRVTYPL